MEPVLLILLTISFPVVLLVLLVALTSWEERVRCVRCHGRPEPELPDEVVHLCNRHWRESQI
jgi:hypothetical protein